MLRERFGPKIQVLNYCVPDNKFSDEIVNFALHLRFLQPKIWISMNGDNDFSARNTSSSTDVMYLVGRRMFSGQMLFNSRPFFYNFQSLFKVFSMQSEISRIQKDLIDSIEPGFTQKDVSIYLGQLKNALSLAHGAGIKFVHILQPVMQLDTHRVTVEEKENLEIAIGKQGEQKKQFSIFLGNQRFYSEVRPELIKLGKDKTLPIPYHFHDFQNVFERAKDQTVYSDSRHYNELGQKLVAERIFSILNSLMEGP